MIVANTKQFDDAVAESARKTENIFKRLTKLEFQPKVAPVVTPGGAPGHANPLSAFGGKPKPDPYSAMRPPVAAGGQTRGDSLQAVYDLAARAKSVLNRVVWRPRVDAMGMTRDLTMGQRFSQRASAVPKGVAQFARYLRDVEINFAGAFDKGVAAVVRAGVAIKRTTTDGALMYRALSKPIYATFMVARGSLERVASTARAAFARVRATVSGVGGAVGGLLPGPYALIGLAASVGVSVFGFQQLAKAVTTGAIENQKFATSAGVSLRVLQTQAGVMRYVGGQAEDYVDGLKQIEQFKLSAQIGDYGTSDLMSRLGGDAERLLKSGEALNVVMDGVNDSIMEQGTGLRAAVLASHVYGENAAKMLRYMNMTKATREAIGGQVVGQGNVMPSSAITQLRLAELYVSRIQLMMEGIATKAVVAFAPFVLGLQHVIDDMLSGLNSDKMVADMVKFASVLISQIANIPTYFKMGTEYIVLAVGYMQGAIFAIEELMLRMSATAKLMARDVGGANEDTAKADGMQLQRRVPLTDANRASLPGFRGMVSDSNREIDALKKKLLDSGDIAKHVADIVSLASHMQPFFKALDIAEGLERFNKRLIEGAKETAKSVVTPYEELTTRLRELDMQLALPNNLSSQSYGRAVMKAFTEAESKLALPNIALPSLARKDSTEAVSAINRSEVEYRLKVADTPAVRQERILQQLLESQLRTEAYAKAAADAAQQRTTVKIPGG